MRSVRAILMGPAVFLVALFLLAACGEGFMTIPSKGSFTVSWNASKESGVNSAGGGYRIYFAGKSGFDLSQALYVDVPYASGPLAPTLYEMEKMLPGDYYIRVASYREGPSGRVYSEPSEEASVTVENPIEKSSVRKRSVSIPRSGEPRPLARVSFSSRQMEYDLSKSAHRKNEILVRFKEPSGSEASTQAVRALGGMSLKPLSLGTEASSRLYRVQLEPGVSVEAALNAARLDPSIEMVQPNFVYRKFATPVDARFNSLWALKNTGQTVSSPGADEATSANNPGTAGYDIKATSAWDVETDCSSVVVAVVDTGVHGSHEDLADNMWTSVDYPNGGYDFVDNDDTPFGFEGHGTHVAGIIGAVGDNGVGTTGLCWKAKIMAVRVLDDNGEGTTADVVQGVDFAVSEGAKIINLSLGLDTFDAALRTAIQNASDNGVIVVASAGNSGTDNESTPVYPCNYTYENVICVGALDQKFQLAPYSNYSKTHVHMAAPGTNIVGPWNGAVTDLNGGFSSGWTKTGWANRTDSSLGGATVLANPTNWNGSTAKYSNSVDQRAYKSFDIPTGDRATLSFYLRHELSTSGDGDILNAGYIVGPGDPFAAAWTSIGTFMSTSFGSYTLKSVDLNNTCLGATCTIGFQLSTDSSDVASGVAISEFNIRVLDVTDTSYNLGTGTSMAAPYVAAVAALVWSVNPGYSAQDVVTAIKEGGQALSVLKDRTITGKALDALGAVVYLAPPTGLSLTP